MENVRYVIQMALGLIWNSRWRKEDEAMMRYSEFPRIGKNIEVSIFLKMELFKRKHKETEIDSAGADDSVAVHSFQ